MHLFVCLFVLFIHLFSCLCLHFQDPVLHIGWRTGAIIPELEVCSTKLVILTRLLEFGLGITIQNCFIVKQKITKLSWPNDEKKTVPVGLVCHSSVF